MNTLTTAPVAPLLDRLFEEADAASPMNSPLAAALSVEQHRRLMQSKTDYLDFYSQMKDFPLAVSRETGLLLYMLARSSGARTIVEFGTSFGISTRSIRPPAVRLPRARSTLDGSNSLVISTPPPLSRRAAAR